MKLREPEDEDREQREARAGKKRQRKKRKGRPEDLAFTDPGGSVHILTVGAAGAGTRAGGGMRPGLSPPKSSASVPSFL